ncbi:NACHT domain protein [Aspergillus heteromorphus CBS 117.55]|uniref:NACHT domain protein n=1 Tax=Aspergillus heteromorphus CBS 117.55 TaxID=1448321 RepID=A0A317VJL3_9EURO|nr:NACHT domain protein [Aspergillus heteromorphus CBS 117.55]PWY73042.1 NACHT domain protein [Aspergillus heteromorphus CBS 117.55]
MATSFQPNVHYTFGSPLSPTSLFGPRRASDILEQENYTNTVFQAGSSRRGSRRISAGGASTLAEVVNSLSRRNGDDTISSIDADYASLLEWIRYERMRKLPPEGSGYDKALVWAALFVERLHSFDSAIEQFAGDSHMAAQLAYVHCGSLLELGEQNAPALQDLFGFFYRCSMGLGNLLDRTELFTVSQEIKDQLILSLADLVTLVVNVATHFHRSLLTSESVSIDICSTFPGPIESFRGRCEHVSELMWRHQLMREGLNGDKVTEIKTIKGWLEPEDPVLANISETTAHFAQEREESTCLWVTPYLTRFLKSDQQILSITGKPGSGKSILSTVINDHLQHPVGGVTYKSIFAPINSRIPANTTPRAVAKTILSQLFDKRIGNVRLYQILADAYYRSQRIVDEESYDDILWSTMGSALKATLQGAKELVLVVDGVDEASCGETVLLKRLHEAAQNATKVKLVVLSSQKHSSSVSQTNVNITSELIFDDIAATSRKILQHSHAFNAMSEDDQELNVTRVAEASDGSFLWAKLAARRVCDEHPPNANALTRSIESIVKAGYTITDHVAHTLQSKLSDDGKKVLVWLATAVRPLTHRELAALVSIQIDKATVTEREVDLYQVLKPVASLVFFQNNLVYLRHGQIRGAILDVFSKDKFVPVIKNRNSDLARRLLLYAKQTVTDGHDPSVTPLDDNVSEDLLEMFPLLDFALRYWVNHTKIAFGCSTDQEIIAASKDLRSVIPTCPTIPLLEMTVWENKSAPALKSLHEIQTRLYRQILTANHPTTLQTILCQALFYRRIHDSLPAHISRIFYDAAKISQEVLSVRHLITMQMTKYFLETTADQISESKTEVMVQRIEMLELLVECYKIHYGVSSSTVTSTLTQLSEHYHSIKEDRKAQDITKSLQGTTTETTATQRSGSRQIDDSLLVHLRGRKDTTEPGMVLMLDGIETDELITWSFNFQTLLTKAERAASEGHVKEAESTFVQLWQQASRESRLNRSTEWELKNRRENEAASILGGFWEEYEQTSSSSGTVVAQFMEVAKVMKSVGLSVLALSVFRHCAQSTESKSSTHQEAEQHIQATSREVMRMASTSSSVVSEASLKEMVYNSSSTDQVSTTATDTLVEMYLSQHRWHDATKVIKTVLQSIWPAFFAPSIEDVVLPSTEVGYCVDLAERLANCYRSRRRPVKEEDIRVRLYRAVRRDRPAGDRLLERVTSTLLRLYERTSQTDKAITIHQDVLHDSTQRYGAEHPTVVKKLWTLAELTRPRPIAVDYYRRIVHILNKDSEGCHPDAFEPLIIVATELLNQGRYTEALKPCRVLFNTLQNPNISQKLHDQAFVQTIYQRYVHCLRMVHSDAASIHDVTVQYRKTCISLFGATATVTLMATKTLANICQETKRYESEAIQLYEELLRTNSSEVDIDHQDIRATLDAICEEQGVSLTSVRSDKLTAQQMQNVVSVRSQRLSTVRSTHGWAHEEALSQMAEIASLYATRGETHAAVSMLQEATVQVLSTETSSTKLTAAAKSIASSYIASGQVQRAKELTSEIYRQIVAKDTANASSFGFDLSSNQRQSLAFLAQLEYSLREREDSSVTLNEVYSSLTTEYLYFEQLRSEISTKTSSLQSVTASVARLHSFLLARGRDQAATRVVDQLTTYFLATEGSSLKVNARQSKAFVETILEYFSAHTSQNFVRSVAIASYNGATQLLASENYQQACHLSLTAFKYIWAHQGYSSQATLKLVFQLGLVIAGHDIKTRPAASTRKEMLNVSATIMRDTLGYFKKQNIDLAQLDLIHLNSLIGVLDEQHDYHTLAWVLTSLWNSRDAHATSQPQSAYTLALGRMLVITRYLIGDYTAAVRLAEDIVYNCARVHGPRHPSTVEMTVLLSQMYTSVAQGYQNQKDRRELACRYYKKAASLHENALRVFIDPSSVSSTEMDGGSLSGASSPASSPGEGEEEGKCVRQHLHLLKLAVERLGDWPKEYAEYERLNADLFRTFGQDLKGVDGVDKWNLKRFGSGRAEASDDLISSGINGGVGFYERLAIAV